MHVYMHVGQNLIMFAYFYSSIFYIFVFRIEFRN
jgi:hypothetical protein